MGQTIRSLAMIHASSSFSHIVKSIKHEDHVLVTDGIYRCFTIALVQSPADHQNLQTSVICWFLLLGSRDADALGKRRIAIRV